MVPSGELRAEQRAIEKQARSKINAIGTASEDDVSKIEKHVDRLLAQRDRLADELDRRMDEVLDSRIIDQPDPRRPKGEDRTSDPVVQDVAFALRPEQRMASRIERNAGRDTEISMGRMLRALAVGARDDDERRALSEGSTSAGGYTVPDVLAAQLIDNVRAQMVAIQAGGLTVPLRSDVTTIAKVLTDPTPAWRSEAGAVGEGDPTFGPVQFTARSVAVLVKVSEELLQDSLNIETELPNLLTRAMAVEMDRVALYGSGSAPEPKGVENFTGIATVTTGAIASYDKFIDAKTEVRAANHNGAITNILHPRDFGTLAKLKDQQDQPLQVPPYVAGDKWLTTTAATNGFDDSPVGNSTVLAGDFAKLLIGMRQEVRIEVLKERYRDTLQIGFIAHARMDVAASFTNAFAKFSVTH